MKPKVRVRVTEDFGRDLSAQTTYLVGADHADWAVRLIDEVERVIGTLATHPEVGVLEIPSRGIRKLVLPKLPLVVRYAWRSSAREVVVLRLFHARQKRMG